MININKRFSNYDARRLDMMLKAIIDYKNDQLCLTNLINDLESLFDDLELIKEEWKKRFIIEWGKLEIIYSSMIYHKKKEIPLEDKKEVDEAINNIEKLIQEINS